jgi:glycosyltransferase involved in cell wall biosynthesis
MKVAFATYDHPEDISGVSSWLHRLLPELQAVGVEVEVHVLALGGRPGVNCAVFEKLGVPFRWRAWAEDTRKAVRHCLEMIRDGQPDVYVANSIPQSYYAAGLARQQGLATVGVLHGDNAFYWGIVEQFVNGSASFRLSAVVAVSKFLADAVRDFSGKNLSVLRCIGYGAPVAEQVARPAENIFRLVYVGRMQDEQKRISEVARALCEAARRNPAVEVWLVGDGSERPQVEQIIQASGVMPSRIKLLGRLEVSRIYAVLPECHAFVLLSDYEGLPISMLEAMSAGVVPICLDIRSGIREAITDGVNGLIVRDRDNDFQAAIQKLHHDPALWAKLSANARATVREKFSEAACVSAWLELLRSLASRAPVRSIKLPLFFRLPPPNPKLGSQDNRFSLAQQCWRGGRRFGGRCKRGLFGAF